MRMEREFLGTTVQNPVFLAAGTCGFGAELAGVLPLDALGGLVTKSVTLEPRKGNPPPRVAEFGGGMINSVGLANPGAIRVLEEKLPWLAANLHRARVLVSVAGYSQEEFCRVVEILDSGEGFLGYELNLSCPNDTRRAAIPFALDPEALAGVVAAVRTLTRRPLMVKLAPNTPDIGTMAEIAEKAGADGLTLVNTLPGLVLGREGRPRLGAGPGGVSGPALLAVGVHAVARVRARSALPLAGVGGVLSGVGALQYFRAGASVVQVGTASFADSRAALRVLKGLEELGRRAGASSLDSLLGAATTPSSPSPATPATPAIGGSRG